MNRNYGQDAVSLAGNVKRTVGNSDPVAELFAQHRKVLAERDELVTALQSAMLAHELTIPVNARFALETNCAPKWYRDARAALAKVNK